MKSKTSDLSCKKGEVRSSINSISLELSSHQEFRTVLTLLFHFLISYRLCTFTHIHLTTTVWQQALFCLGHSDHVPVFHVMRERFVEKGVRDS